MKGRVFPVARRLATWIVAVLAIAGCGKESADAPAAPATQSKPADGDYERLVRRGVAYIAEWGPPCDELESPGLDSIQRGTVTFIATGGGAVDPPIPAIVARITGTCVRKTLRERKPIADFWMLIAYDRAFARFTCVMVGGDFLIREFVERGGCTFVPNAGAAGLIAAAPPSAEAVAVGERPQPRTAEPRVDDSARPAAPPAPPRPPASDADRAPRAPSPAKPDADRGYAVQIAAFSAPEKAVGLRDQLAANGLEAYTEIVSTSQGMRTRVRLGPYAARETADRALRTLRTFSLDGSIVPL